MQNTGAKSLIRHRDDIHTHSLICPTIQSDGISRGFGKLPVIEKSNKPAKLGKAFSLSSSGSFFAKFV